MCKCWKRGGGRVLFLWHWGMTPLLTVTRKLWRAMPYRGLSVDFRFWRAIDHEQFIMNSDVKEEATRAACQPLTSHSWAADCQAPRMLLFRTWLPGISSITDVSQMCVWDADTFLLCACSERDTHTSPPPRTSLSPILWVAIKWVIGDLFPRPFLLLHEVCDRMYHSIFYPQG